MEAFATFKAKWIMMISKDGVIIDDDLIKQFEEDMFNIFLNINSTLQQSSRKIEDVHGKVDNMHMQLNMKNEELIKVMTTAHDFENELYMVKSSARSIVKYFNTSLKASSNIISRAVIEMVCRDQLHLIDLSVENSIHKFCQRYNCSRHERTILESLKDMEKSGFLERISKEEKEDIDLVMKWSKQRQEKKYFLPTNDILKRIWMKAKSDEIISKITHPILGTFTADSQRIEKSFFNLYKTLSEIAHTHGLNYEQDVLPIPDVDELHFKKVDALALASFYSICLPKIPYEIVTRVVNYQEDPFQLISNCDCSDILFALFEYSRVTANVTTTCFNKGYSVKRKFVEDTENAGDST